jgi:hypothetical protein
MFNRPYVAATLLAAFALLPAAPAFAAGETLITHAKALAGNVTPGDAAGYPITISIPGSFELASNLFVAADKIGIQVISPYVTIDLNGFLMQGSNVAWYGIAGGVNSVIITNGIIAQFEFDGIVSSGNRWVVERMQVLDNGRHGIVLNSSDHRVHDNTVVGNDDDGIRCLYCIVRGTSWPTTAATESLHKVAAPLCSETIFPIIPTMGSSQGPLERDSPKIPCSAIMAAQQETKCSSPRPCTQTSVTTLRAD